MSHKARSTLISLSLFVILFGVLWVTASPTTNTQTITDALNEATVEIIASPGKRFRANECFTLSWHITGATSVYLNNNEAPPTSEENRCDSTPNTFEVQFNDGTHRSYTLQVPYTAQTTGYGLIISLTLLSGLASIYLLADVLIGKQLVSLWQRKRAWMTLLVGLLLLGAVLAYGQTSSPAELVDTPADNTTVHFSIDQQRHWWFNTCYTASWSVEGVNAVYFNESGTIGDFQTEVCDYKQAIPQLDITLPDDTTRTYTLPLTYVLLNPFAQAALVIGFTLLIASLVQATPAPIGRITSAAIAGITAYGLLIYGAIVYGNVYLTGHMATTFLPILLLITSAIGTVIGYRVLIRHNVHHTDAPGWFLFPSLLVLMPGFINHTVNIMSRLHTDGRNHAAILYGVMNNGLPPEHVWFAGETIRIYWLFHALFVVGMEALQLNPTWSVFLIYTPLTFAILYWTGRLIIRLGLSDSWNARTGIYTLFLLFSGNIMTAALYVTNWLQIGGDFFDFFRQLLRADLMSTYPFLHIYRLTGFQLGILFALIVLNGIVGLLRDDLNFRDLLLAALGITATVAYHATTALFLIINLTLAFFIMLAIKQDMQLAFIAPLTAFTRHTIQFLRSHRTRSVAALILFVALSAPIAHYLLTIGQGSTGRFGWQIRTVYLLRSVGFLIPLIVFALQQVQRPEHPVYRFMGSLALVATINTLTMNTNGQDDKFAALTILIWSIIAVYGLHLWLTTQDWRADVARLYVFVTLINTLALMTLFNLTPSPQTMNSYTLHNPMFTADGIHLNDPQSPENAVCTWMRENTPADAVLIIESQYAGNTPVYLCERPIFYAFEPILIAPIPDAPTRGRFVETLFQSGAPTEQRLMSLHAIRTYEAIQGRPLYLRLYGDVLTTLEPHISEFERVYEDENYTLFRLN